GRRAWRRGTSASGCAAGTRAGSPPTPGSSNELRGRVRSGTVARGLFGASTHVPQEDLVQPWLDQLEAMDLPAAHHPPAQDRWRVGAFAQQEVVAFGRRLTVRHFGAIEPRVRALEGHADDALPLAPLDLLQLTVEHAPRARDEADALAQTLGLLHQMRGE